MMTDLWDLERRLWIDGQEAFTDYMDLRALMIFPEPIGMLYDGDILAKLRMAPRWSEVSMTDRVERQRDRLVFLNYRATADRDGHGPYNAMCTSVWQRVQCGHRIVAHQQTPSDMVVDYPDPARSHAGSGQAGV